MIILITLSFMYFVTENKQFQKYGKLGKKMIKLQIWKRKERALLKYGEIQYSLGAFFTLALVH